MNLGVPRQLATDPPRRPRRLSLPPRGRFGAVVSGMLSLGTLIVLLYVNQSHGDPLGRGLDEYAAGGSGKWRGDPQLQNVFRGALGLVAAALVLAVVSALRWREDASDARERLYALAPIAIAIAVAAAFVALGVPTVALM